MKRIILIFTALAFIFASCHKESVIKTEDNTRTVKAWVSFGSLSSSGITAYYKPGITFDKPVKAKGTAIIKMVYPGSSQPHYFTLKFIIGYDSDILQSTYSELTDIVAIPGQSQSVSMESFEITEGDYKVTIVK